MYSNMLATSLYCIIIAINPGYTHLDPYLVFYNLPCITERNQITTHFSTFVLPVIHLPPSPLYSPLQIKCRKIVSSFSWILHSFKEPLKTILMRTYEWRREGFGHGAFGVIGKPPSLTTGCQKDNKFCCYFSWW